MLATLTPRAEFADISSVRPVAAYPGFISITCVETSSTYCATVMSSNMWPFGSLK